MESYYETFDEVVERLHGHKQVTTAKNDVLNFLDTVQLFLNKKLMLGLMAQRITGAIESDEIDELLVFAKTLVPKIVSVSDKIRNFVPQEVSGVGITGSPEEKNAILEFGKLREELIHSFRKAREKTTDMAEILFAGYLKSSFRKGRLYPNFHEFEARNYLKINATKTNERKLYYEEMANRIKRMVEENKLKNEGKDENKKAEIASIINEIKAFEEDEKSLDYFDFLKQDEVEKFYEIDEYERFEYLLKLAQKRKLKKEALFVLSVFERLSEADNEDEVDVMTDLFDEEGESEGFEVEELDIDSLLDEV